MERIVETLEVQKPLPEQYAAKLRLLSMRENEYPMIPDYAIEEFLLRHLKRTFKKDLHGEAKMEWGLKQGHGGVRHKISSNIIHREKKEVKRWFGRTATIEITDPNWIGYQYWDEMPLQKYSGNPPEHVLNSALRAKEGGYAKLSIVTVNCRVVEDPLLIAFKGGKRYLLDWWDNDFTAEEIEALCASGEKSA